MTLENTIKDLDEQITVEGLKILIDPNVGLALEGDFKIDFVEDKGITIELLP